MDDMDGLRLKIAKRDRRHVLVLPSALVASARLSVGDRFSVGIAHRHVVLTREPSRATALDVAVHLVGPLGVSRHDALRIAGRDFPYVRQSELLAALERLVASGLVYTDGTGAALCYYDVPERPRRTARERSRPTPATARTSSASRGRVDGWPSSGRKKRST